MTKKESPWDERKKSVMRVRSKVLHEARSWLTEHGFYEVQGPVIMPAIAEWKSYFRLRYYDLDAVLSQGLGPYAKVFIANLGRTYAISPSFRAEMVNGDRRLTEYWLIEAGIPHGNLEAIMEIQERLVTHICQHLPIDIGETTIQKAIARLKRIRSPFPRLTYSKAIDLLRDEGYDVQWGATLEYRHEKALSVQFKTPFFISRFPISIETYSYRNCPENPMLTLSVDLLAPEGYGELSSGGEPAIGEEMLKKMKEDEMNLDEQKWYASIEEMGSTFHSGFAMGVERLIQWLCSLEHITDASAFPRLHNCLYP